MILLCNIGKIYVFPPTIALRHCQPCLSYLDHSLGPHCSPPVLSAHAQATSLFDSSPAPYRPVLISHRPTHRPISQPGLAPAPRGCLLPEGCPWRSHCLLLAGVLRQALAARTSPVRPMERSCCSCCSGPQGTNPLLLLSATRLFFPCERL